VQTLFADNWRPFAQALQPVYESQELHPGEQPLHTELIVAPITVEKVFAGQDMQADSSDCPVNELKVPAPHFVQDVNPVLLPYVPFGQARQPVTESKPEISEYVPIGHG